MKGLLTKDFALFFQRKRTFLFLAVWAIVMCFALNDGSFAIGWMTIIASFFAVSSITYDEYDNCYPFLMSFPVTGKIYALEKYLFGFICGMGAWVYAVIIYFIYGAVTGSIGSLQEELASVAVFIPVFMLLIDISLPLNIKYGTEKGRIAIFVIWGVLFVGFFLLTKVLKMEISMAWLKDLNLTLLVPALLAFIAVLTVVSIAISVGAMTKKEF